MKQAGNALWTIVAACVFAGTAVGQALEESPGSATDSERDTTDSAVASVAGTGGEDEPQAVSFEIGTGLEYDSNVAVLELDTSIGEGDTIALVDLALGYDKPSDGRFDFRTGYNFSERRHEDFDAFDVRVHRASATLAWDLESVDTGASLQYAHAELDGDEFLVLEQISPYVQRLMGERLFLRFAYADTDKSFAGNAGRDASAGSVQGDAYVFINGLTAYLVFGYKYSDEDAIDNQFDYEGNQLKLQLSRRFGTGTRALTFKTYLRHETRDYPNPTLSIGAPRRDERTQLEFLAELPLNDRLLATFGLKRSNNDSNLQSLNFNENVFTAHFGASF